MRLSHTLFLLFILCTGGLGSVPLRAQDSLVNALEERLTVLSPTDTAYINTLNRLSYKYYMLDIEQTRLYSEQALELANAIQYDYGRSQAKNYRAIAYAIEGDPVSAMEYNKEALDIALEIGATKLISNCYNDIGILYVQLGLPELALDYYHSSLKYSEASNYVYLTCFTLNNIAELYDDLGETQRAQEYMNRIAVIAEAHDHPLINHYPAQIKAERLIEEQRYSEALVYLEQAYKDAYGLYTKSILTEINAQVLHLTGQDEKAKEKQMQAIELMRQMGTQEVTSAQISYCELLFATNDYHKLLLEIKTLLKKENAGLISPQNKKALLEMRIKANRALGNPEAALADFETYQTLQDSIFSKEKFTVISQLDAQFRIKEKEKENEALRAQQVQAELLIDTQERNVVYLALAILLALALATLLYFAMRQHRAFGRKLTQKVEEQTQELKKSNALLKASNEELERFAFVASHDLKSPLRNIISFTGLIRRELKDIPNAKIHEYLQLVEQAGSRMNNLIVDVLEYSRVSYLEDSEETEFIALGKLIEEVHESIREELLQRQGVLQTAGVLPLIKGQHHALLVLFQNLVENALKYNESPKPTIIISATTTTEDLVVCVCDNGIGIAPEYKEQIFVMFNRLHTQEVYEGSGLGLAICKKVMQQIGGEIHLLEKVDEGSTFELRFPLAIVKYPKHQVEQTTS